LKDTAYPVRSLRMKFDSDVVVGFNNR
jgi:hypothetical protein